MTTLYQLQQTAEEAHRQAAAIARSNPESEQIRILAIATAETAHVAGELAKKMRQAQG